MAKVVGEAGTRPNAADVAHTSMAQVSPNIYTIQKGGSFTQSS